MKELLAAGLALISTSAFAQEFVAPKPPAPPPIVPAPVTVPPPTVEGIVKEIFTVQKPWQLVNPVAPKSYGNGTNTTSWSEEDPGKPKGFIVFAIEW